MSRHLELCADVPIGLHFDVGGINIFVEDSEMRMWPRISIPGQYLLAMEPLFEAEPWHDGNPRTYFGAEDSGIAKLDDWSVDKADEMIRRAIGRIRNDDCEDVADSFWKASPKNVRRMLEAILRITEWAVEHEPTATWTLYSF